MLQDDLKRNVLHLLAEFDLENFFEAIISSLNAQNGLDSSINLLQQKDVFGCTPFHLSCVMGSASILSKFCKTVIKNAGNGSAELLKNLLLVDTDLQNVTCVDICVRRLSHRLMFHCRVGKVS